MVGFRGIGRLITASVLESQGSAGNNIHIIFVDDIKAAKLWVLFRSLPRETRPSFVRTRPVTRLSPFFEARMVCGSRF